MAGLLNEAYGRALENPVMEIKAFRIWLINRNIFQEPDLLLKVISLSVHAFEYQQEILE